MSMFSIKKIEILVIAVVLLSLLVCACSPQNSQMALPSAEDLPAIPSVEPTDEPAVPKWMTDPDVGFYAEQRAAAEAILRGEKPEEMFKTSSAVYPNDLGLWFDLSSAFSGGELTAYDFQVRSTKNDPLMEGRDLSSEAKAMLETHIAARYPSELAPLIRQSLVDHAHEYDKHFPNEQDPAFLVLPGFCGDGWILVATVTDSQFQVHAIFQRDGGGNWHEIKHPAAEEYFTVTGACVTNEGTAFLCCYAPNYTDTPHFCVRATFDGGETWEKLPLEMPEEYAEYIDAGIYKNGCAFSPLFSGERGVILIRFDYSVKEGEWKRVSGWFQTEDGGHSWKFHTANEITEYK